MKIVEETTKTKTKTKTQENKGNRQHKCLQTESFNKNQINKDRAKQ